MHGAVPTTLNFWSQIALVPRVRILLHSALTQGVRWEFSTQCSEKGRWYRVVAVVISLSQWPGVSRGYPGSEPSLWVVEKLGSRVSQSIISCICKRFTEHLPHALSCPRQHRHIEGVPARENCRGWGWRDKTTHELIDNNTSPQIPRSKDLCSVTESKREALMGWGGPRRENGI